MMSGLVIFLVDMSQSISWLVGIYGHVPATRIMKIVDYAKHFFFVGSKHLLEGRPPRKSQLPWRLMAAKESQFPWRLRAAKETTITLAV